MAERLDVIQFKKTQNDKTYAVRLGSAVPNRDGDGFMVFLDAMPAPVDGQYRFSIVPPREQRAKRQPGEDDGDDRGVPF